MGPTLRKKHSSSPIVNPTTLEHNFHFSSSYKLRSLSTKKKLPSLSNKKHMIMTKTHNIGNLTKKKKMGSTITNVTATFVLFFLFTTCSGAVSAQSPSTSDPNDQFGGYAKVTPSMAIIIVVLIAALFFMGFFSIYIRHCSGDSASGSVRPAGGPLGLVRGSRRSAPRGLDAEVIGTFPTMQYSEVKGLKLGKGVLECAVCLNEFEDHETLRLIPKCDHVFHPECIDAWLVSHVTCPVCRANLTPQPVDDVIATEEQPPVPELDLEVARHDEARTDEADVPEPEQALNRDRTRGGSGSWRARPRWFPRSHSTGHSLVQPGENTDRFTLRLPEEVRKQIMSRQLERTMSLVVLPRERSSRSGFRVGGNNEGSSRGKNYNRLEKLGEPSNRSDQWVFTRNPSLMARASSFLTRASSTIMRSGSVRSPRVAANNGEGTSTRSGGPDTKGSNRPPV